MGIFDYFKERKEKKEMARKERIENYKRHFDEYWCKILKNGHFEIIDIKILLRCNHSSAESIANDLCSRGLVSLCGNVYFIAFAKPVEKILIGHRDYVTTFLL